MAHDHDHDDPSELGEMELRVRALETVLAQKGYIDPPALDVLIDTYQTKIGPRNGARVVARAWVDPVFREWLLRDATAAIASLGYTGRQGEHIVAVANSPQQHHMVVCTLCSCYPWPVLGLPPTWYKSAPYRSRAVKDPRGVLAEFGVTLPESTAIRVWDSTAEIRYLVIPERPAGTEGLDEAALAELVTRDSMIGTGLARAPKARHEQGRAPGRSQAGPHPLGGSAAVLRGRGAVMSHLSHADLGGQAGNGPIVPEPEGELFHADWEPRALALTLAMGATGAWNIDMSRSARETLPDYAQRSYYAIWLAALEKLLIERGLVGADELGAGRALHPGAPVARVLRAADVPAALAAGSPTERAAAAPARFTLGDRVRTRAARVDHHTRLPGYAQGKLGTVERVLGAHVFADSHAQGRGADPQWLYTVVFDAHELWGDAAQAGAAVSIDAWEPYLEPAA
jgi:nitrile hydratase